MKDHFCNRKRRFGTLLAASAAALLSTLASGALAQADPFAGPARNLDARIEARRGAAEAPGFLQQAGLAAMQSRDPGLRYRIDPETGTTRALASTGGFLTRPSVADAPGTAAAFLNDNATILGLEPTDVAAYAVKEVVASRPSGASHVYLQQKHRGLEVYNAVFQANLDRERRITGVSSGFVKSVQDSLPSVRPTISANRAVKAAAEHLGIELGGLPRTLGVGGGASMIAGPDANAERLTAIDPTGISDEPINARLMILPIRPGESRLVWNFQIYTLDHQHWFDMNVDAATAKIWTRFDWVASDQYRVYAAPAESPNHVQGLPLPPSDGRTLVIDPADPTASPASWHSGNLTEGNNVRAYVDSNNSNSGTPEDCGLSRSCDFPIDLTQPPNQYIPAAVANLFYWNNIIHDVMYQYGFDEGSGNFQENNFGNGGNGGDSVNAEAQDGGGVNNANFATPPDGGNPRMQMYRWTPANPDRDSDLDNGIIVHEYGHGISIRLVGGPSNVSCLNNQQQPGEGWSDWFALALTAEVGDAGTDRRGIGTYVINEPTDGTGIRAQPYSTDPARNTWTFESIRGAAIPHGVGAVWAQGLWEVYWALVDQYGFDPDLYNAAGGAGNQRALLYVTEGLKSTACSPTFLDARDGVIQAVLNNDPADECLVWQAFADYGLGVNATTTGANSTATNGFEIPVQCQCDPQPVADAGPDQTVCLGSAATVGTPALPEHSYSWLPGGETTARITVTPLETTTYTVTATTVCRAASDSATVFVDTGEQGGLSEDFEGGAGDWSANGLWHLTTDSTCASPGYSSPLNAFYYGQDGSCNYATGSANSGELVSPPIPGIKLDSTLTFDFFRQVERYTAGDYDRTFVDVSDDDGVTWTTVWSQSSRDASQNAWVSSAAIALGAYAESTIRVRFSFDSRDNFSNGFTGWFIDDVVVSGESQCEGGNQPPAATITAPPDGSSFAEAALINFTGTGIDAEDGDVSASLEWVSSIDGALGSGASISVVLSVGVHTVTATATDSGGATGGDSITVTVNNVAPTVTITSPPDGADVDEGTSINFSGTATDPGDGNLSSEIAWSSNLDGALGTGAAIAATLSVGTHTITASVADSNGGTGDDAITVTVNNVDPTVTITSPPDGADVDEGTSINFSGTATDPGDGDLSSEIAWSSNLDGALGTGAAIAATLSVGTHTITASVADSNGGTGDDVITVTVNNVVPTVSITAPPDGTIVAEGATVNFAGTASDPGDGDLSAEIAWSSNLDGALGTGASLSVTLSVGTHSITAMVTDSNGAPGSDSITVTVNPNGIPVVTITSPANGASFDEGQAISFAGSAVDPEDGNVSASLTWTSSLDGVIGSGPAFVTALSVGTHTVIALATDSDGAEGSGSISVTVLPNTPPVVTITGPGDGATFTAGDSVTFMADADDDQDGDVTASLVWASSLDGTIGSGASFSTTSLSVGTHTITATATDSLGETGDDSITVTIESAGGDPITVTFTSIGSHDGWVREASENSGTGGASNSSNSGSIVPIPQIRAGDWFGDRQYKSILSFDTSSIPDGATITSVTLETTLGRVLGSNPFDLGMAPLLVDANTGGYGGNLALENSDFQAASTAVAVAAMSNPVTVGQVSSGSFDEPGRAAINRVGTTQLRLYFSVDDDDDGRRDTLAFYSGDDDGEDHPRLVVTYVE